MAVSIVSRAQPVFALKAPHFFFVLSYDRDFTPELLASLRNAVKLNFTGLETFSLRQATAYLALVFLPLIYQMETKNKKLSKTAFRHFDCPVLKTYQEFLFKH